VILLLVWRLLVRLSLVPILLLVVPFFDAFLIFQGMHCRLFYALYALVLQILLLMHCQLTHYLMLMLTVKFVAKLL
jgi:hypothetical protein